MNTLPINTGDTAFMILCTAMVCLMTPGLAFFYGGLARKNNILTIMSQSFLSVGITTIMWVLVDSDWPLDGISAVLLETRQISF